MASSSSSAIVERSFSCRIERVKAVIDVLSCLLVSKKDQICGIDASRESLLFVVSGRGKSTQIRVNLPPDSFDDYVCTDEAVQLNVNLTMLLDCLQLFGAAADTTTVTITYSDQDAIFRLTLEDDGVLTTCDLCTLQYDDFNESIEYGLFSAFLSSEEDCQVILKSEILKDSIQELFDVYSCQSVSIEFSQHPAFLKFSAKGVSDICEIEFPKNADIFVSFQCRKSVKWTYGIQALQLGMKSLGIAKETFIRVNAEGVVCVQHQVDAGAKKSSGSHLSRSHSTHRDYGGNGGSTGGGGRSSKSIETYVDFLMVPFHETEESGLHSDDDNDNDNMGSKGGFDGDE